MASNKLFETGIDLCQLIVDMTDHVKKPKPNTKPPIDSVADLLQADTKPVINVGDHQYEIGIVHPKTGRIYIHDRSKMERGDQTEEWTEAHFQNHIFAIGEAPPFWDAVNDYLNETGLNVRLFNFVGVVWMIIGLIPNE